MKKASRTDEACLQILAIYVCAVWVWMQMCICVYMYRASAGWLGRTCEESWRPAPFTLSPGHSVQEEKRGLGKMPRAKSLFLYDWVCLFAFLRTEQRSHLRHKDQSTYYYYYFIIIIIINFPLVSSRKTFLWPHPSQEPRISFPSSVFLSLPPSFPSSTRSRLVLSVFSECQGLTWRP